jgi:CBS domain-containing protein
MSGDIPVHEVMLKLSQFPNLPTNSLMVDALEHMSKYGLGIVCAVDTERNLLGVFTDGDLRRMLLQHQKPLPSLMTDDLSAHISAKPQTVLPSTTIREAVEKMEDFQIWDLPVVDLENKLCGLLHLHPVIDRLINAK